MKPSHFYFDERILEKEKILFDQCRYIGHELLLDQTRNYYCLPQEDDARVLVYKDNKINLLSNVCRHRQSIMLSGSGNASSISCPLHGWTYDLDGKIIAAPKFNTCPDRNLTKHSFQSWNGLLFQSNLNNIIASLDQIKLKDYFSFKGFAFHSRKEIACNYNWKTFIEVQMDNYHIANVHPGLNQFVDCNQMRWQHGERFNVQSVGIYDNLQSPGSDVYKRWHDELLKYRKGVIPEYGGIWLTIYPNIMIEWYPEVLVIMTIWPEAPQRTQLILEYYYPEEICLFEKDFVAAHQAADMETALEDDELGERIDRGRRHLSKTQMDDYGPIHDPLESGLTYFYDYYDRWIFPNNEK
jgi:choline monooxygenase